VLRCSGDRPSWHAQPGVEVTVDDGVVTLTGPVDRRSFAQVAERLVRRTDGVVDVVNRLTYAVDDGGLRSR
jgi:osmotically-inducible protein OsmY